MPSHDNQISVLRASLEYARRGFRIIPLHSIVEGKCTCVGIRSEKIECRSPGKHPRFQQWPVRATSDELEIKSWFTNEYKGSNIGIATGANSNIFVLDIDPKNGGDESFESLVGQHGKLPDTLHSITGGGGRHFYFMHPGGIVPNTTSILPGLDIRGDGGQVVAAPSIHISGRRYQWGGPNNFQAQVLPSPIWLLDMIAATPKGFKGRIVQGKGIGEGERNATLARIAGGLRRNGMQPDEINLFLQKENIEKCHPPLEEKEVRQIARSIGKYQPSVSDWQLNLLSNRDGKPKPLLANACDALRHAPEWTGLLAFDEFSLNTVALKSPPWGPQAGREWTDHEDKLATEWLQHKGICISPEIAGQAVQTVAREHPFHPVRDYLNSLVWDGKERIKDWLSHYLGAKPSQYAAAVGPRWLVSAVARIYQPGAKADCCLILEGPQGLKKSTALKTIAGQWFTDEIADLGSKDAAMQTRGVWIIELAELHALSRGEVARIKAFMSRSTDRFRPPYGKRVIESPRQCVFAGSANHDAYLTDETGARRFWPVACSSILIDELGHDRNQLWAEAVDWYRRDKPWWLESEDLVRAAENEQGERFQGGPWDEAIALWISSQDTVSVEEILSLSSALARSYPGMLTRS